MLAGGEPSVSGDVATAATATATVAVSGEAQKEGGGEGEGASGGGYGRSNNSGEDRVIMDDGERGLGGNRWPRQETLALLKIRSDMDAAFRDATIKAPLWDDVSRKLGELGYNRSAKKCKEKFENVFKYHKRTKDGRSSKGVGKTYRFFDQLETFQHHHPPSLHHHHHHQSPSPVVASAPASEPPVSLPMSAPPNLPSTTQPITLLPPPPVPITVPSFPPATTNNPSNYHHHHHQSSNTPSSLLHNSSVSADFLSNSTTSSFTSSDVELEGMRGKKKSKWRGFFERVMQEVVDKQEELQKRFLEAIEKREKERMLREEAWRMQEITRISREREILAQERSVAAAKDAAVMAFLQKVAEQQNPAFAAPVILSNNIVPPPPTLHQPAPAPAPTPVPAPVQSSQPPQPLPTFGLETMRSSDNGARSDYGSGGASSSRWPKAEVEALIKLRTNLDSKYQENGPKGPLWEEISAGMRNLGYNRNAKRCKEKWENINKYFKKVKESNKRRPQDSKTCPYFLQLDALYREKNQHDTSSSSVSNQINSVPLMVRPEQQWPPSQQQPEHQQKRDDGETEDMDSDQNVDDDDDDDGGGFEIVQNKQVNANL